jgi:hypothetical protein
MFPVEYVSDTNYTKKIESLKIFVSKIYSEIEDLVTTKIDVKEKIYTYVRSNDVQKIISEYLYKV